MAGVNPFYRKMLRGIKPQIPAYYYSCVLLKHQKSMGIVNPRPFTQDFRCSKKKIHLHLFCFFSVRNEEVRNPHFPWVP